ncbi:DUF664 domain-containing protein [Micromonospora sp. CA-240977]|uniref:mycothiol transferase n=1 Tax=Micromonospora sp. CA-240977 TaxID=3239957 RepID=UPI003D8D227A
MKCDGLDAEQLGGRSVPPSTLSLLGLVRHSAQMENHWFQRAIRGTAAPCLYKREDGPDWDCGGAVPDDPAVVKDVFAAWKAEIAKADEWLDALEEADLGREVPADGGSHATSDVLVLQPHLVESGSSLVVGCFGAVLVSASPS